MVLATDREAEGAGTWAAQLMEQTIVNALAADDVQAAVGRGAVLSLDEFYRLDAFELLGEPEVPQPSQPISPFQQSEGGTVTDSASTQPDVKEIYALAEAARVAQIDWPYRQLVTPEVMALRAVCTPTSILALCERLMSAEAERDQWRRIKETRST